MPDFYAVADFLQPLAQAAALVATYLGLRWLR